MKIKKYIPIGIGVLGLAGLVQQVSADTSKHVGKDETKGRLDPDYKIEDDVQDEAITSPNGGKVIKVESKEKVKLPSSVGELSVKDTRVASNLSVKDAREGFTGVEPKYIVDGGNDIVRASYSGTDTAVTKVYYVLPSGQGIPATGTFISPNIVLSVAHMYLPTTKDAGEMNKIVNGTFHYNMGTTAPLARDWIPRDGSDVRLGGRDEMAKRMYFVDQNKYSSEYDGKYHIDFQYDIALMKVDTPMQFTSPSDDAEPLSVVKQVGDQKVGDTVKYTGYGISFDETQSSGSMVTNPNIQKGNLLSVTTKLQTIDSAGVNGSFIKWQATTVGGFSGSSVRDSKDEIFGILQYGRDAKAPNGYGGGLKFNQKTLDWIHKVINDNKVVGWREYNGGRYYFQDNGHLYRNTTKVIDGERWQFNQKGIATSLGKVEYGGVTIEYVDTEGKPLLNGKTLVEKDEVGTNYNYDASKDPYTSSLNSNWELKSVQMNGKDLGKNPSISGKVVAGKTVYKFVYSKKNANIKVKYTGTGQEETLDNGGKGYPIGSKVKVKPKQIPGYHTNDTEKEITIGENNVVEFKYTKRVNVLVKYTGTGQEETLNNGGQGYVVGEKIKVKPKQIPGYHTNDTEKEITIGENNVVEFKYTKRVNVLVKYTGTGQEESLNNDGQGYVIGEKIKVKPKQIPGYHTNDTEKEITIGENNVVEFNYTKRVNVLVKYKGSGQEETLNNGGQGYVIGEKIKVKPKQIPGYHTNDTEKEITIGENNVVEFKYTKRVNVLVKYKGTGQEETLNNGGQGYVIGEKVKVKPKQIPGFWTKDTEKEITIGENNVVEFEYTKDTDVTRLKQLITEGNNTPKDVIESKYSSPGDKVVAEKLVKDIGVANEIVKKPNDHLQEKVNDLVKTLEKDISDMIALRKKQQKLKDVETLDNEGEALVKKVRLKNRTEDSLRKYEEAKTAFVDSINTSVRNIKSGKLEETVTPALANLKKAISELKYKPIDKKEYEKVRGELNTELGEKLELEYLNDTYRNEYKKLTDDVNGLIAHVGRQLPEDLLQEEFDEEVDRLKVRVPEVRELKAKLKIVIEEEKVRRTIAEYVKLSEEIRNFTLNVGSENKELLNNLAELAKKLDVGNNVLRDKSGVFELRKVIDDVRSGFNQVKESDKKTVETDSFNLTYGIRGGVNVTFTNSTPIGSVSSTGEVKDGKVSRVVNSRLGSVVDTRDAVTEKPQDKQITVGTKNERRFVRYETKPYKVVGKGQVLVSGVTGLVEVWNINGEEVRFEVRDATDEVRG